MLIHDITPAKTDWERGYAHLAYEHTGLKQTFSRRIPINKPKPYNPELRKAIMVIESFRP